MILKENFWFFKKAIPNKICDKIYKLGSLKEEKIGVVGKPIIGEELKRTRNSNVSWLNEKWVYDLVDPFFVTANKNADWNFEFDYFESAQFTKYNKGQHYNWHADGFPEPYNNPNDLNYHNKIRKLSGVLFLSHPKEYEGGELLFDLRNKEDGSDNIISTKEFCNKGTIVIFPSFIWHRVTPVTKGKRHTLVIWALGKKFK
jgi:PKHD-type hydroxylase